MLDDTLHINNVNPFYSEPPGAWSRPYKYTPTVQNTIENGPDFLSNGGDPRGVEYRCKLERPLYPRRNIDAGLWTVDSEVRSQMATNPLVQQNAFMIVLGLILLFLILDYLN